MTQQARELLLREGTDLKFGARHLKRAIERSLVHPLSSLVASEQVRGGDFLRIDFDAELGRLEFIKEAENMPVYAMKQMMDATPPSPVRCCRLRGSGRASNNAPRERKESTQPIGVTTWGRAVSAAVGLPAGCVRDKRILHDSSFTRLRADDAEQMLGGSSAEALAPQKLSLSFSAQPGLHVNQHVGYPG